MAAILCKSISDCCGAVCNTIGNICILPFKCCGEICNGIGDICSSPFSIFCFVALVTQIPPIIVGFMEISGLSSGCQGSYWLLGAILFGIINITAALYLTIRIGNTNDETLSQYNTALRRATYLLCHDPWMACYIIVAIGYLVFLVFGTIWNASGVYEEDEGCADRIDTISRNAQIATLCGWIYIFGGSFALGCSMCCACCDRRDYSTGNGNNGTTTTQQTPSPPPPSNNNPADDVENPAGGGSYQQGNFYNPPSNSGGGGSGGQSAKFNKSGQQPQKKNDAGGYGSSEVPSSRPTATTEPTFQNINSSEPEIPMAYAEAIPEPPNNNNASYGGGATGPTPSQQQQPTAPPSFYDNSKGGGGGSTPASATAQQQSSSASIVDNNDKGTSIGSAFGRNVGKLFNVNESKQQDFEKKGQQAGEAIGKGLLSAKKFVKSKIDKNSNKDSSNTNNNS